MGKIFIEYTYRCKMDVKFFSHFQHRIISNNSWKTRGAENVEFWA